MEQCSGLSCGCVMFGYFGTKELGISAPLVVGCLGMVG